MRGRIFGPISRSINHLRLRVHASGMPRLSASQGAQLGVTCPYLFQPPQAASGDFRLYNVTGR